MPKRSAKVAVILLVDDDSAVREITASILRDLGHMVIEVGSGGGALDLLDRNAQIELVVLDFAMPGMNGMEVARQVRIKVPSCPVMFITGYATHPRSETLTTHRLLENHLLVTSSPTRCNLPSPIVQATEAAKSLLLDDRSSSNTRFGSFSGHDAVQLSLILTSFCWMRQWPYMIIDLHRVPPIDPSAAKLASIEVLTIVLDGPLFSGPIYFLRG